MKILLITIFISFLVGSCCSTTSPPEPSHRELTPDEKFSKCFSNSIKKEHNINLKEQIGGEVEVKNLNLSAAYKKKLEEKVVNTNLTSENIDNLINACVCSLDLGRCQINLSNVQKAVKILQDEKDQINKINYQLKNENEKLTLENNNLKEKVQWYENEICSKTIVANKEYNTTHSGNVGNVTGKIIFRNIKFCPDNPKRTCFEAKMSFDRFGDTTNNVKGYWEGKKLVLNRPTDGGQTAQRWEGDCNTLEISGVWSYTNAPQQNNPMRIY